MAIKKYLTFLGAGVAGVVAALTLSTPANANPSPPTNGGNGAGHSGQCTGNPDDRPEVCPAT